MVHVGDGGHTSGSGGAHGGADAGSPPSSSGGGGGADGPTDGPPHGPADGPSHASGREWHPSDGDPVLSDADYGPDFTRVHEGPVDAATKAIEDNYGQPMADHGTLDDAQLPPRIEDLPQDVKELVTDPEAPYGRDAANNPYSREDFEARYVDENGDLRYPPRDGAVPGRIVEFTSITEFQKHYSDVLDRFGGENGKYFSPDGTSFEARALPPRSLHEPYIRLRLSDKLPIDWKIEVSQVAPAFGRDGGGMQIRILDAHGQAVSVKELRAQRILKPIDNTRWPVDWPRPRGGATPHYGGWSSDPFE